jgi:hypothetical protein
MAIEAGWNPRTWTHQEVLMLSQAIRHTMLVIALAALPGFAAAAGSQAGDNGRQPIGADNDSPRQAIPNAMTNDGTLYDYGGRVYYRAPLGPAYYDAPYYVPRTYAPSYYVAPYDGPAYYYNPDVEGSLLICDRYPLAERPACRDAAMGRYYYRRYPR